MKITVKDIKQGKALVLEVDTCDTTQDVKKRIEVQEGIAPQQQRLIFKGKTLDDSATLSQSGVTKGSLLHIIMRLNTSLTLDIRVPSTGRTIAIDAKPSETAQNILAMIEELVGLPADQHTLMHAGKQLMPMGALTDQHVIHKSILRLIRIPMLLPEAVIPQSRHSQLESLASCGPRDPAEQERDRVRVYGDLGTLYARCGGIFGVAGFVDHCMDKWMADRTLNANAAVATWHGKAQRCGFKFLVTQLMGYLAGGPQRYTGRPMAASHKHLNISSLEWGSFMQVFHVVCKEFGLFEIDVDDLAAVLSSMEVDCVVHHGETAPPKPQPAQQSVQTLYGRAGGVYPLALFADRLVDALLEDKRANLHVDGQKRNEASLKYFFTELVCNICDGPEVMTSTTLSETRLLLPAKSMFFLLDAAKSASDHLPSCSVRRDLIVCLHSNQHLIIDLSRHVSTSASLQVRQQKVKVLGDKTGVTLLYIPRGGVVKLDFDASPQQLDHVKAGLEELGLKTVEKTKVKTAAEAAAGNMLSATTIASRYAAPGAFVAARKRVHGDPRTLYGRGGGVFGLAKLVDRLMDVWMGNAALNLNSKVAKWHESQQKFGFKFLVVQIFGYLTGGPQKYTGQPMDVAHKHLGITSLQWEAFMKGVDQVFTEFKVELATQQDLKGILASFRDQIIVPEGQAAPADPGLCRKNPSGNSLYAVVGGVYPLAQFADIVVEKVLSRNGRVHIPHDPSFKRTPAGLKYLLTELICSSAGGPEVVTSRGFDDAKLGVPVGEWPAFLEIVAEAAAVVWPSSQTVHSSVQAMLDDAKAEVCIGLVTDDQSGGAKKRRRLMQAGFSHLEVSVALDTMAGDEAEALALLASGWTPAPIEQEARASVCPFTGAIAGQGVCPMSAAASDPAVDNNFVCESASSGSASGASMPALGPQAGRILGNPLQLELDDLLHEESDLLCPITLTLCLDPVIASDGCIYERSAILELIRIQGVSPVTHAPLTDQVVPAQEQKSKVGEFMAQRSHQLLLFAARAVQDGQSVIALAACDRLKDYVSALGPQHVPDMVQQFGKLCNCLGKEMPSLNSPYERIQGILKSQVAQAKAEVDMCLLTNDPANEVGGGGSKSVIFTLDVSGSMKGHRITKARENLTRVFDQHIEDEDHLALVTFSHEVRTEFQLQKVGANRASLRSMAEAACFVRGGTAFYDALAYSVAQLDGSPQTNQQWIVALTDGHDQHSKSHSLTSALAAIQASKRSPDLIVIGIQLTESLKPEMEKLCTATENSIFIDASGDLSSLDAAFQQVAELICE